MVLMGLLQVLNLQNFKYCKCIYPSLNIVCLSYGRLPVNYIFEFSRTTGLISNLAYTFLCEGDYCLCYHFF